MTTRPSTASLLGQDLTMAYDGRVIGQDVSLAVPEGEFTVVIGPNACGKSTLLRTLARLLRPQAGAVLLDGKDIHHLRA